MNSNYLFFLEIDQFFVVPLFHVSKRIFLLDSSPDPLFLCALFCFNLLPSLFRFCSCWCCYSIQFQWYINVWVRIRWGMIQIFDNYLWNGSGVVIFVLDFVMMLCRPNLICILRCLIICTVVMRFENGGVVGVICEFV